MPTISESLYVNYLERVKPQDCNTPVSFAPKGETVVTCKEWDRLMCKRNMCEQTGNEDKNEFFWLKNPVDSTSHVGIVGRAAP